MNILVLSCGTGGGHNTAAMAVVEEMKRRGHSVMFRDAYELVGSVAAKIVNNSYIKTVQHIPKAFGVVYSLSESISNHVPGHSAVYLANGLCTHALKKLLNEQHFDAVVMSHIFAAHMLTYLRNRKVAIPKTYLIVTDYTCHPFSHEAKCDYVITPSSELTPIFTDAGITEDKLLPLGIPVKCEFARPITKGDARRELGLSPDGSYILLSGGSIGASAISSSIHALSQYLSNHPHKHLIVICGSNQKLYEKLRHNYAGNKQILIVGKTDKMPLFLKAADVFITKPGGLSTTEAAVCATPMILMPPIPGCETYNIQFFEKHGMCIAVQDPENELLAALESLDDPDTSLRMQHAQRTYINSRSTEDLCDHIEASCLKEEH
ncbi:MAG: glycosyltransferase [Ruminococcaceae bacterium]|nr:glycosyltransferase [Oscillospiraceae bacterium]